MEGFAMGLTK
jgi:hypothetical protein